LQEIEQRERLQKEILDISEREQRRIGQELHDGLQQELVGMTFNCRMLGQKLAAKSLREADDTARIGELLQQAIGHTRDLARTLYPVDLDASGLMFALEKLASRTEQLFGIRCSFKCDMPVPIDEETVAINLYRIAQEAVTNAIKHGRAKNIQIELASTPDKSVLTVENDGRDFPKVRPKSKGMGLQIMNYRAEMIDGSLNVCRGARGGTVVTCVFPNKKANKNRKKSYDRAKTARQN